MEESCFLVLEDGSWYPGRPFGAPAPSAEQLTSPTAARAGLGEVVFVTGMTGYHETLTDPSYTGQIVTMTYPHAGNYGCDPAWNEQGPETGRKDRTVKPAGMVVRTVHEGPVPSGRVSLSEFLSRSGVPGITDVDTRRLTLDLRDNGARNGAIVALAPADGSPAGAAGHAPSPAGLRAAVAALSRFPAMEGRNLVGEVGTLEMVRVNGGGSPRVALLDCGVKAGIVRELTQRGCEVIVLPSSAGAEEVRATNADALFVSNGPGDPATLTDQVRLIGDLLGTLPVLGICLGHQLIARALGASTCKMTFGHHGLNHPVRDQVTGRVFVTSQNHGFAVEEQSLPPGTTVWLRNANDGTVEGILHADLRVACVQFHPEASPGPLDATHVFDTLLGLVRREGGVDAAAG